MFCLFIHLFRLRLCIYLNFRYEYSIIDFLRISIVIYNLTRYLFKLHINFMHLVCLSLVSVSGKWQSLTPRRRHQVYCIIQFSDVDITGGTRDSKS